MKSFAIPAAAIAICLPLSAQAEFRADPGGPKYHFLCRYEMTDLEKFRVTHPMHAGDIDPITDAVIDVQLDRIGQPVTMEVQIFQKSGKGYERSDQYTLLKLTQFGSPKDRGYGWQWDGMSRKNPTINMSGMVLRNNGDNTWRYEESLWLNPNTVTVMHYSCQLRDPE
jgi:hypothetical protein